MIKSASGVRGISAHGPKPRPAPRMISKTAYHKLTAFDGLEILAAQHYHQPFPWHAHETFNLSLITGGTEGLQLPDTTLYAPAGHISITHPQEVHANPVLHAPGHSFYTFYVSPAVMARAAGGQPVYFPERVIYNEPLFSRLLHLTQRAIPDFNRLFGSFLRELIQQHSTSEPAPVNSVGGTGIETLKVRLIEQLHAPVSLEQLARQHGMNKFKLLRYFKQHTGLTPHGFVLMQRVEAAKHLLQQGHSLVDAGLAVGFYDQAHFSRFFKSFVGVSPGRYQSTVQPPLVF